MTALVRCVAAPRAMTASPASPASPTPPPSPVPVPPRAKPRPKSLPDTLVLSGGGVKGVAMLGAAERLRSAGMLSQVHTVIGTSAGALIGALVATRRDLQEALGVLQGHGYTPDFDFERLGTEFGLDSGRSIQSLSRSLLGEPGLTFAGVRQRYGTTLVVCVTNVSKRRAEYLGPCTHPDMPVELAIRMSCSVPLYFSAVRHQGDWYVDGSIVDNFPCAWATDNGAKSVLGVSTQPRPAVIKSFEAFMGAVVESAACSQAHARADVLDLDLPAISSLHFGASPGELAALFASGLEQADAFVKKRV